MFDFLSREFLFFLITGGTFIFLILLLKVVDPELSKGESKLPDALGDRIVDAFLFRSMPGITRVAYLLFTSSLILCLLVIFSIAI